MADTADAAVTADESASRDEGNEDEQGEEVDAEAAVDPVVVMPIETEYTAEIAKTDKGLGIYFARHSRDGQSDALAVDGFVEGARDDSDDSADKSTVRPCDGLARLEVGDVLTQINGVDCSQLEVAEIATLLRSAPMGANTLRFRRPVADTKQVETRDQTGEHDKEGSSGSLAGSFIGALRKVKSRMKAEMDEEAKREQEENERFEKQWLAEFDRFKAAYEVRWETCTYTADEFCGHMYRSSYAQQRAYLEQEYPTLMEAWKECQDLPHALPQWPPVKVSIAATIEYAEPTTTADSRSGPEDQRFDPLIRDIECAPTRREALEFLRHEFMWRSCHVDALSRQLEALDICSCSELVDAMETGARSCLFERRLQSPAFPRLTKSVCRALRDRMEQAAASRREVASADQLCLVLG